MEANQEAKAETKKPNPIMEFEMRRFDENYEKATEYKKREKTPSHSKIPNFGKSL